MKKQFTNPKASIRAFLKNGTPLDCFGGATGFYFVALSEMTLSDEDRAKVTRKLEEIADANLNNAGSRFQKPAAKSQVLSGFCESLD